MFHVEHARQSKKINVKAENGAAKVFHVEHPEEPLSKRLAD